MFGWRKRSQKKVDDLFSEYVRPDLIEAMKSPDFNPALNTFRELAISFIWVAVHGANAADIGKDLGVIADTAKESGWYVDCLFSNLIILGDGAPLPAAPDRITRAELVARLREKMGSRIKLLHGSRMAPWGSYGGAYRRTYGAMFQDFLDLLCRLHDQPYGTAIEIAR